MRNRTASLVCSPPLTPLALAVALALAAPQAVFAAPVGATVVAGQVQVSQPDARTTLVTQGSDKAIVDWRSFSIGAGETVRFQQPGSDSVVLNRVTTAAPSEIFGRLSANGKVFLVNPSGILFGKGAAVDVGTLVASTLDIGNDDFLAGRYDFAAGAGAGAVRNEGVLAAAGGGTIALLGAQVGNDGTLSARLGTVALAAGAKVSLDFNGDGLTRIVVDAARLNALVENGGAVIADGGLVSMTARALDALAATVVRQGGVVQANALVERNGRIFLDGGAEGTVALAGTLAATGLASGQHGGEVLLLGRDIALADSARIDVRGDAGGGALLAGGDARGAKPLLAHAASVTMAAGAAIRADAVGSGDGGKVILWSDGATSVHGALSANGGVAGGNGGLVETSGKVLDASGSRVSAAAPRGRAGAWLLDPTDIDIDAALAASIAQSLDSGTDVTVSTRGGPSSEAVGNIGVHASIDKSAGADATLVLEANNSITVDGGVHIAAAPGAGKLHLLLNADVDGSDGGVVTMLPGSTLMSNGGDIRLHAQSASQPNAPTHVGDAIQLDGASIDARVAQRDGGASGAIDIIGMGDPLNLGRGVRMVDTSLLTTTGAITIAGDGGYTGQTVSRGVEIRLGGGARIASGSGDISISGAAFGGGSQYGGSSGAHIELDANAGISSAGGAISISGASQSGSGVALLLTGGAGISAPMGALTITGAGAYASGVTLSLDGASLSARQINMAGTGQAGGAGIRAIVTNGSAITTTGGALVMSGTGGGTGAGLDIILADSQLGAAGGDLLLSGTGGNGDASGVAISSRGESGIDGSSGAGGVMSASSARLSADHGNLVIAGINGTGSDNPYGQSSEAGVELTGVELRTVAGDIRIAGTGVAAANNYATGIALNNVLATAASGAGQLAPGSIRVLGLSSGAAPGLLLDGVTLGGAAAGGDIILGARNAGPDPMIAYGEGADWRNSVQTAGRISIRPDDQNYDFRGVPASAVPISVGAGAAGTGFNVDFTALGIGGAGPANVVIGSREQTGAIIYSDPAPFRGNLVLQNDGAASEGIVLASNINVSGQLTLSTGGRVDAPAAAIGADALLLHGAQPESRFVLTNPANSVAALGIKFDVPKSLAASDYGDVTYVNSGALRIGGLRGAGFSTASNGTVPIDAVDTVVAGDLLARASGKLALDGNISTLGSNITLVTGGVFDSGGHTLNPAAGDKWLVFADTWGGENRSGLAPDTPHPNYYNCAYGAPCAAAITGNRFVYRAQPLVTLTADHLARLYGDPNPAATFGAAGLVNGDTAADAVAGAYASNAAPASPVGTYQVNGAFTSPVGYAVAVRPGTLTVERAALLVAADDKRKVYGDADPLLSASISGLKLDDTAAVVSGLTLRTATGAAASAGSHPIVAADGVAANYTISYLAGTLTVDKAALLVRADDKTKVYGAPEPVLTATVSGWRYDDGSAALSGLTLGAPAGAAAGAGNHPIVAANASAANYAISYVPGVLAVDQAALTYVAAPATRVEGAPARALDGSVRGFVYGDTVAGATGGALEFTSQVTPRSPPGVYAVQGRGLAAANYRFLQAQANDSALLVVPTTATYRPVIAKDMTFESSNVYQKNFGTPRLCVGTGPLASASGGGEGDDVLALEWSRVRVSPNLSNCVGLGQRNACSDF